MLDMLEIYEVNRKEGARLFLELPRWWNYRTFKGRDSDEEREGIETMQWTLECTTVEVQKIGFNECLPANQLNASDDTLHLLHSSDSPSCLDLLFRLDC